MADKDTKAVTVDEADEPIVAQRISRSDKVAKKVEGNWPPPEQRAAVKRYAEELAARREEQKARRR